MKIFLGDFRVPIDCELISYDKLQEINDNPKEDVCGLYVSKKTKPKTFYCCAFKQSNAY